MHLAYTTKLGFRTRKIDVSVQKIDGSHLRTFKIVIVDYLVKNKFEKIRFFQKTFLSAIIGLEVILEILFLTLSRVDV